MEIISGNQIKYRDSFCQVERTHKVTNRFVRGLAVVDFGAYF